MSKSTWRVSMSPGSHIQMLVFNSIESSYLTSIDYEKVALGSDVLFVGFPNDMLRHQEQPALGQKGDIWPQCPSLDFNGRGEIVIDAQVFAGSSGSPVFVDWDETYKLHWCHFRDDATARRKRIFGRRNLSYTWPGNRREAEARAGTY